MPRTRKIPNQITNMPALVTVVENKRQKFHRLANQRTRVWIHRTRMIGHLGSDSYEATPEDVDRLVKVLQTEFDSMIDALKGHNKSSEITDIF